MKLNGREAMLVRDGDKSYLYVDNDRDYQSEPIKKAQSHSKGPGLLFITEDEMEEALIDPRRLLFERVVDVRGLKPTDARFEVWIVWSCKTLQNRKWIMATSLPDNNLYELTYDGETGQFYLDEYVKVSNTVINAVVPEDLV